MHSFPQWGNYLTYLSSPNTEYFNRKTTLFMKKTLETVYFPTCSTTGDYLIWSTNLNEKCYPIVFLYATNITYIVIHCESHSVMSDSLQPHGL